MRELLFVPAFPWARVGVPELGQRVHARFVAVAERWSPDRDSLCLLGPTGVGKTSACVALVWRLAAEAIASSIAEDSIRTAGIVWTTGPAIVAARRGHPLGQGEAPLFEHASWARVLVLDEIGQEGAQPAWLLELLDLRYQRGLPTISTSGLRRAELEQRYGSGAVRRLIEPGGAFVDVHGVSGG